jgi:cytidine deaminase
MPISQQQQDELCQVAIDAMQSAYAPYSHYAVGAAILTENGRIFAGCNVENASYGLTMCAERIAAGKAVSEGGRKFLAVAVATRDGGSPCGACRQVLAEFADGLLEVFLVNPQGQRLAQLTLDDLLPYRFSLESPT